MKNKPLGRLPKQKCVMHYNISTFKKSLMLLFVKKKNGVQRKYHICQLIESKFINIDNGKCIAGLLINITFLSNKEIR